jgi:hypothetical protein
MASRTAQPRTEHPSLIYEEYDPLRAPDWRAQYVMKCVREGVIRRYSMDSWMQRFAAFMRPWYRLKTPEARHRALFRRYPDVYYAYVWHHHTDQEHLALLQAALLSDMPMEQIAIERNLYLPAVEAYEALFFNVLDRLDDPTYIVRHCLNELNIISHHDSLTSDEQRRGCYKLFGYFGGPEAVKLVFSGLYERRRVNNDELAEWSDNAIKAMLRRTSLVAIRGMDVTRHNVMRLLELQLKSFEIEQDAKLATGQATGAAKQLADMASQLLSSISWRIGKSGIASLPPAAQQLRKTSFGLTATEADKLAAGETLPELQAAAAAHTLPMRRTPDTERVKKKKDE